MPINTTLPVYKNVIMIFWYVSKRFTFVVKDIGKNYA